MEAIITVSLFLMIFGIFYLFLSTRNKERLALIEKGVDARIFIKGKSATNNIGKIIILNLALLLMGIGIGVFIGLILSTFTLMDNGAAYSATIFTMAGVGLFIGFYMTKKLDQEEKLHDSQTL